MTPRLRALVALLLCFAVSACDSSPDDDSAASFTATVERGTSFVVEGRATFAVFEDPVSGGQQFALTLSGEPYRFLISLERSDTRPPEEGEYPFLGPDDGSITTTTAGLLPLGLGGFFAVTERGTLRITRSDESRVVGSFEAEGVVEPLTAEEDTVRFSVSGTFDAARTASPQLP